MELEQNKNQQNILSEEDKKFETVDQEFANFRFAFSPEFSRIMGQKVKQQGQLDDNSLQFQKNCLEKVQYFLTKLLTEVKYENLNIHRVSYKVMESLLTSFSDNYQYKAFMCPLNGYEGPHSVFLDLISALKFENEENYIDYKKMLQNYPVQLQQNIEIMRQGLKENISTPQLALSGVPESIEKTFKNVSVEQSLFFQPLTKPFPESMSDEKQQQELKNQISSIIQESVFPALENFHRFVVEEYIPQARKTIACKDLPNGENMYRALLQSHTTTNFTPEQIFEIGQNEVKRIKQRMVEIMKSYIEKNKITNCEKLIANQDLREFQEKCLHNNPDNFCKTREELVNKNVQISKICESQIPHFFHSKVGDLIPYEIVQTAQYSEANAPPAYYLYLNNKGYFYVNTGNLDHRPIHEINALVLHEAIPGHHYQQAKLESQKSLPKCRSLMEDRKYFQFPSRFPFFTGYLEGWGLYCEYLGEEMGIYNNELQLFGRLGMEILRACRLVVDTGIHYFNWSYEQGVEFMMKNSSEEKPSIEQEVKRYIYWPGQACGYKIGEIKIRELRQKSETELKDKFSLKDFHEIILNLGPVPLNILEEEINMWIQKLH